MLLSTTQGVRFGIKKRIQRVLNRSPNEFAKLILDLFFIDLDYIFHGLLLLDLGLKCRNFKSSQSKEPFYFCETKPTLSPGQARSVSGKMSGRRSHVSSSATPSVALPDLAL